MGCLIYRKVLLVFGPKLALLTSPCWPTVHTANTTAPHSVTLVDKRPSGVPLAELILRDDAVPIDIQVGHEHRGILLRDASPLQGHLGFEVRIS